ncbi:MAG: hypothetical protein IJN23_06125 [Akkermansia sp.]|nr:hypothetical protein [Akkermansia sp.]
MSTLLCCFKDIGHKIYHSEIIFAASRNTAAAAAAAGVSPETGSITPRKNAKE